MYKKTHIPAAFKPEVLFDGDGTLLLVVVRVEELLLVGGVHYAVHYEVAFHCVATRVASQTCHHLAT